MMRFCVVLMLSLSLVACRGGKKKVHTPKVPKGDAEITDTYWRLYEMDGKLIQTPADARDVFIRMNRKKSTLEGFAGCNNIGGTHAEGRHGAIKFEPFSTLMACEERMATEQYVLKALVRANRDIINDKFLLLYDENILLATFEARYYK